MTQPEFPIDLPAAAQQARRLLLRDLRGEVVTSTAQNGRGKDSPVTRWVRGLEKDYQTKFYIASEVAEHFGISVQAVRKYAKKEVCGKGIAPSKRVPFGEITINLYTDDDLKALENYLAGRKVIYNINDEATV